MKIHNLDRFPYTLPGGVGCPHDRAVVLSETETEPHIITGKPQPKCLFRGTLEEAHGWASAYTLELTRDELETILIALNVEQDREMRKGTPAGRKLVTELRDRVAEMVRPDNQ